MGVKPPQGPRQEGYIFCFSSLYSTSTSWMTFLCRSRRSSWISLREEGKPRQHRAQQACTSPRLPARDSQLQEPRQASQGHLRARAWAEHLPHRSTHPPEAAQWPAAWSHLGGSCCLCYARAGLLGYHCGRTTRCAPGLRPGALDHWATFPDLFT